MWRARRCHRIQWTIEFVRKLVVFLGVLLVLVVGADVGGRAIAETRASEAIAGRTGLPAPSVDIHGFSFLVQAIPGRYSNISLASSDVTAGPITGIAARMELYDVDFPLGDAIRGDTSNLTAGSATVNGVIPDSALTSAIGRAGTTVSAGPDGTIRVSSAVGLEGQSIPVTADLVASYDSGVLRLNASGLTAGGLPIPEVSRLTKELSVELPLKNLPFTVEAANLRSSGTDLILTATANNVKIGSAVQ
jgi:hypothetical protein